jgi:anti-anti-sigma factor
VEDKPLDGSLHYLRGEYEQTREVFRTRRNEMPEAQVKMNVRQAGERASIIDVEGELTAFAEAVLMDAYNQASDGQVRAIILNFEDLEYMNSSGIGLLVTRLDDAIAIHDSEEEAVRAANSI